MNPVFAGKLVKRHESLPIIFQAFDTNYFDNVLFDVPIEDWEPLYNFDMVSCVGWSSTPLYDAIHTMGRRLKDLDPPRCSIVIVTDGHENASRYTDLNQAKAILDWCRAKGWQVTFIGANFNNRQQADLLGSNPASAIGVERRHLVDATKALAEKRKRYGLYGENMHYTEEERQQFGGYLTKE